MGWKSIIWCIFIILFTLKYLSKSESVHENPLCATFSKYDYHSSSETIMISKILLHTHLSEPSLAVSALREWVLDSREVKSEEKMSFTLFEKCKWKKNDLRSRSRNESEMKMTENRDREVKVKWKSFEIEIEKWNFSRIFENLKRTDFDLSERVHLEVISFLYVIC